jgi:hypothetical protein
MRGSIEPARNPPESAVASAEIQKSERNETRSPRLQSACRITVTAFHRWTHQTKRRGRYTSVRHALAVFVAEVLLRTHFGPCLSQATAQDVA